MGKQMQQLIFMKMLEVKSLIGMQLGLILEQVSQMVKQMHYLIFTEMLKVKLMEILKRPMIFKGMILLNFVILHLLMILQYYLMIFKSVLKLRKIFY
jgi:hypothetical protein